jgi:hypothetical protein
MSNDANLAPGENCDEKGEGRMHIQLQTGGAGPSGYTVPNSYSMKNEDPPGVLLSQVTGELNKIWGDAQGGRLGKFPKTGNWDLYNAIIEVSVCAKAWRSAGGTIPFQKNICQGMVGNSGWRLDLDQDAGRNLTQ